MVLGENKNILKTEFITSNQVSKPKGCQHQAYHRSRYQMIEKNAESISKRFTQAREKVLGSDRNRIGIGTLSEKTLHAILKNFYEPNEDKQEIPIDRYVADIYTGTEIIEIQTGQFNRMRDKLNCFLQEFPVTIVYPVARQRWLHWIDEETGEVSEGRKSPKKGNEYSVFVELYRIKAFLTNPNLKLKIVLLDMDEYKLLNGWGKQKKNNASKYDRIPNQFVEEICIDRKEDYLQFIPYDLLEPFTVKEYAKAVKCSEKQASVALNLLHYLRIVDRVGKKGNAFLYETHE